jgi:hypothetical protein
MAFVIREEGRGTIVKDEEGDLGRFTHSSHPMVAEQRY